PDVQGVGCCAAGLCACGIAEEVDFTDALAGCADKDPIINGIEAGAKAVAVCTIFGAKVGNFAPFPRIAKGRHSPAAFLIDKDFARVGKVDAAIERTNKEG